MSILKPFHVAQNGFQHRWHWPKDVNNSTAGPMCGKMDVLKFASDEQGITCRKCIRALNADYLKKDIDKRIIW